MTYKEKANNTLSFIYGLSISSASIYFIISLIWGDKIYGYLIANLEVGLIEIINNSQEYFRELNVFWEVSLLIYVYAVILLSFFIMAYPIALFLNHYGLNGFLESIGTTKRYIHPFLKGLYFYIVFVFTIEVIAIFLMYYGAIDYIAYPSISLFYLIIVLVIYSIPTLIAIQRKHVNKTAIILTNLLLGITVIGWVIALIWSTTNSQNVLVINSPSNNVN